MSHDRRATLAETLSIGGLIAFAGWCLGKAIRVVAFGGSRAAALATDDEARRERIRGLGDQIGDGGDRVLTATGRVAGKVVNTTVDLAARGVGHATEKVALLNDVPPERAAAYGQVAKIATATAAGIAVGSGASQALVALAAAPGLHGAAEVASGLANLGGGALVTGGGGMATGQVVTQAVAAGLTASTVAAVDSSDSGAGGSSTAS